MQNATRLRSMIQSLGMDRPLPNKASFEHLLDVLGSQSRRLTPLQQAAIVFALGKTRPMLGNIPPSQKQMVGRPM